MTQLRNQILSRRQIEGLIADGRKIVILDGQVLKTDAWLPFHPGGDKAILHMVGRDGTDEIRALHSPEAQKRMESYIIGRIQGRWTNFVPPIQGGTFRHYTGDDEDEAENVQDEDVQDEDSSLSSTAATSPIFDPIDPTQDGLRKRRNSDDTSISSASSLALPENEISSFDKKSTQTYTTSQILSDTAKYPSLDSASQDLIVEKYRALNEKIRARGLYNCSYTNYLIEVCRYTLLFASFVYFLRTGHYALSGLFLGLFWHQLVFTAHDAGHMGITHNFQIDTCIGIFVADFLGGLSMGWWKRSHNVHHIVTNSPEHDPDTELMPFFAISHRFFESLKSTYYDHIMPYDAFAKITVQYQHWLYYPILAFGRFNLYRLSWSHLIFFPGPYKGPAYWHRHLEITGQILFWYWFGYCTVWSSIPTWWDRVLFVLISHTVTAPLHVQITLSHFAMSTADLGTHESFPQKMLRTTMDVECPPWFDFIHGGLQFQAIHHLYPRIPRHNLRKAQGLVREFCEDVGIPYAILGFVEGNGKVIGRLGEVARQAQILEQCRKVVAARGVFTDEHGH
jgi:sphingolipid 8-(E)-desaturase